MGKDIKKLKYPFSYIFTFSDDGSESEWISTGGLLPLPSFQISANPIRRSFSDRLPKKQHFPR